jgi:hypothetical protein
MRTALAAALGLALAVTSCGSSQTQQAAPSGSPTPAASPVRESSYPLTDTQKTFVAAVRKDPKYTPDGSTDWDIVQLGRDFCGMGYRKTTVYDGHGGNPPNVKGIATYKEQLGPLEKNAVRYLCPQYVSVWKSGMASFGSGDYVVGADIKPGRYRTLQRKVRSCYWERTTKAGDTIANDFVTFAAGGVTVTILGTDGGFTSKRCGTWIPV